MKNAENYQPKGDSESDVVFNTTIIVVDLEDNCLCEMPHPKEDPGTVIHYLVKVDGIKHKFKHPIVSGAELFAVAEKDPSRFRLLQVLRGSGNDGRSIEIGIHDEVDLRGYGIEKFETAVRVIHFHVDRKSYSTEEKCLTVQQILVEFAKVDPAVKTLADKKTQREYKDLQELICLEEGQRFTLFDNSPCTVS